MDDSSKVKIANWMVAETLAEYLEPLRARHDVKWRGHGLIYIDYEQYNIVTAQMIFADLSDQLGVPIPLIRSRLIDLGWLNDARNTLSIQDGVTSFIGKLEPFSVNTLGEDAAEMGEEHD